MPCAKEDALTAYEADEYEKALRLFKPLAEQGDADAQLYLDWMYDYASALNEPRIK